MPAAKDVPPDKVVRYIHTMKQSAVKFSLDLVANVYKDGAWWVAECVALSLASQGKTRKAAREMLSEAIQLAMDTYAEQGKFVQVIERAMKHPTSRLTPRAETLSVPVPISLLAARHVEAAHSIA